MRTKPRQPFLKHGHSLGRGLIGFWPFCEGCGADVVVGANTRDCSSHGNHALILRGVWVSSEYGRVLEFDGASTLAQVQSTDFQIVGSLSMVVLFRRPGANAGIKYVADKYSYGIYVSGTTTTFKTGKADGSGNDANATGPDFSYGDWVLAVGVFDAETQVKSCWVNGCLLYTSPSPRDRS